jgi:hypothetical protein
MSIDRADHFAGFRAYWDAAVEVIANATMAGLVEATIVTLAELEPLAVVAVTV